MSGTLKRLCYTLYLIKKVMKQQTANNKRDTTTTLGWLGRDFSRFTFHVSLILCSVFVTSVFAGTTGKITGQVTDEDGYPLPGASVFFESKSRGTYTDEEGIYFLLSIPPGTYTLVAHMLGYEPQLKTDVRISSDFTTNVSFTLKESALQLDEMVVEAQSGKGGWGMFSTKSNIPAIEPDKTTSKQVIRADDIEALTILRSLDAFIEIQAGVTVDEEGDELVIRAGEKKDVGYYFDGLPLPSTDHVETRVYNNFNRLAVQEITIITGGMDAEYGNAQGGIVQVVGREGAQHYSGLLDYEFTPPGKKHWGANVYDSPIHQNNNRWDDPTWVSETVTLPNGSTVPAHQRIDYTGVSGHYLEGHLSGPLTKDISFFVSNRWQRQAAIFPAAHQSSPFNLNTTSKLSYHPSKNINIRMGGLYDRRKGANTGPDIGGGLNLKDSGKNLFLTDANPTGNFKDTDRILYTSLTHLLSEKTFYEIKLSQTLSQRDTNDVELPRGITHISEAVSSDPIQDQSKYYTVFWNGINFERFQRDRITLKADLSSQVNHQHFLKTGFELIRFNNWYQTYQSNDPKHRLAGWYGKTYESTDLFPGQQNEGVNPLQVGIYMQDKMELNGMIVNAGLRADFLFQNTWVTDVDGFYGQASPMWHSMSRNKNAPTIKGKTIKSLSHRIGVSNPMGERSLIRFFYGRFTQFPNFQHLFYNSWSSALGADLDLNNNGVIDPAERWNAFSRRKDLGTTSNGTQHNSHLPPEETTSFEVGIDWNIVSDYVLNITTYYKGANNQITGASQQFLDPETNQYVAGANAFTHGIYRDTRGFELSMKKRFSHMFAFNFALNLQWDDTGRTSAQRRDTWPDSLFVANGHYWNQYDIDPTTGAEIPVSLQEMAIREGKDPDHYIKLYGHNANNAIRNKQSTIDVPQRSGWSWIPWVSHFAAEGVELAPGQPDQSFYSDEDRAFWERINSNPNYPGTGEGTLLVGHAQEVGERATSPRNRQSFGSLALLLSTPAKLGPFSGKAIGNIRGNLVYRFYTGTPQDFTPQRYDPRRGQFVPAERRIRPGPMHTRTDLHAVKVFGTPQTVHLSLGIEVFNLFNQKDTRSVPRALGQEIDFDSDRWHAYGIDGPAVLDSRGNKTAETFDINNYWDQPREIKLSVQMKW